MNPGCSGRSELPENVKAMLRPVSMMVPDFTLIAENMLFSEGFRSAKVLAKKLIAIMELSQRQLSKQDHYDYGLLSLERIDVVFSHFSVGVQCPKEMQEEARGNQGVGIPPISRNVVEEETGKDDEVAEGNEVANILGDGGALFA
ncbi:hypothetical protein L7F22_002760 [Adiantum nelumboides]|nr:hypothetical protein [Adiantum nelumboides]